MTYYIRSKQGLQNQALLPTFHFSSGVTVRQSHGQRNFQQPTGTKNLREWNQSFQVICDCLSLFLNLGNLASYVRSKNNTQMEHFRHDRTQNLSYPGTPKPRRRRRGKRQQFRPVLPRTMACSNFFYRVLYSLQFN